MQKTEEQAAPKAKVYRLKLDHDLVYWGVDEIKPEDFRAGDVVLDHAPDNAPGKYVWSPAAGRLEPLPPTQHRTIDAPTAERALYEFLRLQHERSAAGVPQITIDWCAAYEKSFDAVLGDGIDAGPINKLSYFRTLKK